MKMFEKISNIRDLGGTVTAYGTIRSNRLIRSAELSRMTDNDALALKDDCRLQRVVDLRTPIEGENCPDVRVSGIQYVNISIVQKTTFGISFESLDGKKVTEMMEAGFERLRKRGETYSEHIRSVYTTYVNNPYCRSKYGEFLSLLANCPTEGSTLWHCSLGKDRCGTCTALVLYCLGADFDTILNDYMLTNTMTRSHTESVMHKVVAHVPPARMDIIEEMMLVKEEYLQTFFNEAIKQFGSMDAFISACGITDKDINTMRQLYLQ